MNTVVYNPRVNMVPSRLPGARSGESVCACLAEEETDAPPALLEAFDWMGCSRHEFSLPKLSQ